jgi:hypothetical protein
MDSVVNPVFYEIIGWLVYLDTLYKNICVIVIHIPLQSRLRWYHPILSMDQEYLSY